MAPDVNKNIGQDSQIDVLDLKKVLASPVRRLKMRLCDHTLFDPILTPFLYSRLFAAAASIAPQNLTIFGARTTQQHAMQTLQLSDFSIKKDLCLTYPPLRVRDSTSLTRRGPPPLRVGDPLPHA